MAVTLSNVVQLQAALLSALIREVPLSSEQWQLQSHSYTRCLENVTVKCSAPNKTLIPSSLKFREHCTRRSGEKIRTRSLGERPWKATFWQDIVIPDITPNSCEWPTLFYTAMDTPPSQAQMEEKSGGGEPLTEELFVNNGFYEGTVIALSCMPTDDSTMHSGRFLSYEHTGWSWAN